MSVEITKAKKIVKPDDDVIVWKVGNSVIMEKVNAETLLETLPYLSKKDAKKLALEAKEWVRQR